MFLSGSMYRDGRLFALSTETNDNVLALLYRIESAMLVDLISFNSSFIDLPYSILSFLVGCLNRIGYAGVSTVSSTIRPIDLMFYQVLLSKSPVLAWNPTSLVLRSKYTHASH